MEVDYSEFYQLLADTPLKSWVELLPERIDHGLRYERHGLLSQWKTVLEQLPNLETASVELKEEVRIEGEGHPELESQLKHFHPWRKGPYHIHGVDIDTEWRSDFKWERIKKHISPLRNRVILDVGCGSGYHAWRMLGEEARQVIGIDPNNLFMIQFEAIKKYCGPNLPIHLLPVRMEDVPPQLEAFDTTFSMGVLYHRRSPIDHLLELKGTLRQGGELVLETLVCEGELGYSLMPEDRYAMMRNVWFIPTIDTLSLWLARAGFKNIQCIEKNQTSLEEQRTTDWMQYQSLKDFLDPNDINKTIEGYPAPLRATFIATK